MPESHETGSSIDLTAPLVLAGNAKMYVETCESARLGGKPRSKEWDEWNSFWISMCWSSPQMPPEEWREKLRSATVENSWLIENAIEYIDMRRFLIWFGIENFRRCWPKMRGHCPMRLFRRRMRFDTMWTFLVSPVHSVIPPLPTWETLSPVSKKVVEYVCQHQGTTTEKLRSALNISGDKCTTLLSELEKEKYIIVHAGRIWRNSYYLTFQYQRSRRKIRYRHGGKEREFITEASW